jgi:hypothetical protein
MNSAGRFFIFRRTVASLLILLAGLACDTAPPHQSAVKPDVPRPAKTESGPAGSPNSSRDLSQDESAGGHTLRKHVDRSDDQLRERLGHEQNISAASTWTDRQTAERAVGIALEQSRAKIDRWLGSEGGHPNLVIDYDGDPSHPIGRSLRRDADQPTPCSHATVVLRWAPPDSYYVLTSYPECR